MAVSALSDSFPAISALPAFSVPWVPYVPSTPLPDHDGHDEPSIAPEWAAKKQRAAARDSGLSLNQCALPTVKLDVNQKPPVPFADPIVKLNPNTTTQINHSRLVGLKRHLVLTKRPYATITYKLLETLIVILEPGRNILTHFLVGGEEQAAP
jgi:hypothetical protein